MTVAYSVARPRARCSGTRRTMISNEKSGYYDRVRGYATIEPCSVKSLSSAALTQWHRPLYIDPMASENPTQVSEIDLKKLEYRINELIQVCERLKEENRSLRTQQESLVAERATLIDRNEQARVRVEAMINRLKAMEENP